MHNHDIIVIGASAGGIKALNNLFHTLPPDLPATIFAVLHVPADSPNYLPEIFSRAGTLIATQAEDGEEFQQGRIYVPRPDHHLLVERGQMRLRRGPKENGFRPSVDALFRSAAYTYGPRVVGVILTGYLYDGTAGLMAVKKRAGVAVVQDPKEAAYPEMPGSAQSYVEVDHYLSLSEIGPMLTRLSKEPVTTEGELPMPDLMEIESRIAGQNLNTVELLKMVEQIGKRSTYTCPDCHGTLWEIEDGKLLRFRCHVGHAVTADHLQTQQSNRIEESLWSAVRSLEEKVTLAEQMAARANFYGRLADVERHHEDAKKLEERVSALRQFILNDHAEMSGERRSSF